MRWRIVTAHTEGTLQEPQNRSKAGGKAGEILEVVEDKASGLFVIIGSQYRNDNDYEGRYVPDEDESGDSVKQVWPVYIDASTHQCDEIGDEDRMPSLNGIAGK